MRQLVDMRGCGVTKITSKGVAQPSAAHPQITVACG